MRPVWSESSLCTQWVAKDPGFLHADSEDSDQTGQMPRLIRVFTGRTLTLLVLSCRGSYNIVQPSCLGEIWLKFVFMIKLFLYQKLLTGFVVKWFFCVGKVGVFWLPNKCRPDGKMWLIPWVIIIWQPRQQKFFQFKQLPQISILTTYPAKLIFLS